MSRLAYSEVKVGDTLWINRERDDRVYWFKVNEVTSTYWISGEWEDGCEITEFDSQWGMELYSTKRSAYDAIIESARFRVRQAENEVIARRQIVRRLEDIAEEACK